MIRMFYELSGAQKDAKQRFPKVDPACMGSLQELTHVSWSEAQIINNVLDTMKVRDNMCFVSQADMTDLNLYNKVLSLMKNAICECHHQFSQASWLVIWDGGVIVEVKKAEERNG